MKSMLNSVFKTLTLAVCLQALPELLFAYDGPQDENPWTDSEFHSIIVGETTLGSLARYSDIIGVGNITHRDDNHFTITIDLALVGCTNGTTFKVWENPKYLNIDSIFTCKRDFKDYIPTNNSRIVFATYTNTTPRVVNDSFEDEILIDGELIPIHIPPHPLWTGFYEHYPQIIYYNRSWWYADRDDGVLFTQFTNVIQNVRIERNWTNYFHLCRDGATSTSNRVREDSYHDLGHLAVRATDEKMQLMLDDPLVHQDIKRALLVPNWRVVTPETYWDP